MPEARKGTPTVFTTMVDRWPWITGLGIGLLAAALFVFSNIQETGTVAIRLIGGALVVGGGFNLLQAFFSRRRTGAIWNSLAGLLYLVAGFFIFREPETGSIALTIMAALALGGSGFMRIKLALAHKDVIGWQVLLGGGLFSILIGIALVFTLPWSGIWVLGMLIGLELALQGFGWLAFGIGLYRLRDLG
jgi:uncharacterized membrane protein HdeD (DUF308 family)